MSKIFESTYRRRIIDGDNMKVLGYFHVMHTETVLKQYRDRGRWEHVETDRDGDIILFKED